MNFNRRLLSIILICLAVIALRLLLTAEETGNWKGMWISLLHSAIVAAGSFAILRRKVG